MIRVFTLILFIFTLRSEAQLLSERIPWPFYEVQDQGQNEVMSIDRGVSALQLRLEMIRRATKNIEVEYYIYKTDMAGKILTRELVAAAKRGVKVRILVDKIFFALELDEFHAKELAKYGIEIRYYNAAHPLRLSTVQFRNHRKLLSVDDHEAITGGRNIGDDYFDLSPHLNYIDLDVYVKGPIVKTMRESFDKFFEHKISQRPRFPSKPQHDFDEANLENQMEDYLKRTARAEAFLMETPEELQVRNKVEDIGHQLLEKKRMHTCPETTFSSDAPGLELFPHILDKYEKNYRFLRLTLQDKIQAVDKRVLLSSPYFISNSHSKELIDYLIKKKVHIDLYTNSLASTDAIHMAANLYIDLLKWRKKGIRIYLHDGKWIQNTEETDEKIKNSHWGTHCKSHVYETSTYSEVMIGTFNIDNRSSFYNTEMGLFCKGNDEFSQEVRESILHNAKSGVKINKDGTASDKHGKEINIHGSSEASILTMKIITLPSWLLKDLF